MKFNYFPIHTFFHNEAKNKLINILFRFHHPYGCIPFSLKIEINKLTIKKEPISCKIFFKGIQFMSNSSKLKCLQIYKNTKSFLIFLFLRKVDSK